MGMRVSFSPRKAPEATAWVPSKTWNRAATGHRVKATARVGAFIGASTSM